MSSSSSSTTFPTGWSSIPMALSNLTLSNTLPIGQSFLWHRHPVLPSSTPSVNPEPTEEYSRALNHPPRVVFLRQTPTHLYWRTRYPAPPDQAPSSKDRTNSQLEAEDVQNGVTRRWLDDYFHLDRYPSLEKLYDEWRTSDPGLFGRTELDERAAGVRVLRQDPWECLLGFITSTNNHIPRITSLMHRLSEVFSPPLLRLPTPTEDDEIVYHLFPPPDVLPVQLEAKLREMGFGYRAGFIESTLATLRAEFGSEPGAIEAGLLSWRGGDIEQVREKLIALKGVGRKVADCVMLMCLDQPSLIPIDTHVSAIAARHPSFPSRLKNKPMSKQLYDEVHDFLAEKWGPMGGWCQAVMFSADLPASTTTPRKVQRMAVKLEMEDSAEASPNGSTSMSTASSTAVETPSRSSSNNVNVTGKAAAVTIDNASPLRGKRRLEVQPTAATVKQEEKDQDVPASYGFKRTRSATRIQLARSASGVSVVAEAVKDLEVKEE